MTLVQFQTALTDLTASPALCRVVRRAPATLRDHYDLTDKEWRQLVAVVSSDGMEANCMLYRANRLAPLALNLPRTTEALGDDLKALVSAYWESTPRTDVNFLVETDLFCRFVRRQPGVSDEALAALADEHRTVMARLAAARAMTAGWEWPRSGHRSTAHAADGR